MIVHVGTYNVFGMPWGSNDLKSILIWTMIQSGAEIMCLQEVWSKQDQELIRSVCKESGTWTCFFPSSNHHELGKWTQYFYSGSGLCILLKNTIEITQILEDHTFIVSKGADTFVRKGFMILHCKKQNKNFQIINTHLQSDLTEIPFWRIRYNEPRLQQEKQLYHTVKNLSCPIVLGDFNTEEFIYFECLEKERRWTYKQTKERLDSCLRCNKQKNKFDIIESLYHYNIQFSDHIPVVFRLKLL